MLDTINRLRENISRVFLGHQSAVDRTIRCLLARGHLLIEDVPGVGKTLLAMTLARSVGCTFSRVQLTPDMLPSDVLGVSVLDRQTGEFVFKRGPIFSHIVLADEINRTTPRTQSAMLEAMNEASVSIDGKVYQLEKPFMVVATQNPFEFEGTYALPENQLDRFLMRISVGYPDASDEARVLDLRPSTMALPDLRPVLSREEILTLQDKVDAVKLDRSLIDYIVAFANATRTHEAIHVGLSPRGSLALAQAARATALSDGRDYVIPEDITDNVTPVCSHRIVLRAGAASMGGAIPHEVASRTLLEILKTVKSPV